jgi:type I restriction enzyme S subunit
MAVKEADLGTGRTGGREATTGVIPGRVALSVGCPDLEPPRGWKWTSLSSVAQLESGHTPSRKHPEYWSGDIPWIGIKDATENHGRTLLDTHQHVSMLGLENSSARLLPANTVCLSRTASVGFVVVMGRPMATSQDFVNWVCGPNIEPHYLKSVLLAENEALWRFASGTTHQTIYYPEAKAFHVCLPPLPEQKAIAAVLGALDDKIELNRRMNATLEAMARALFQSWFVDFDPVRAKLDGRQPGGLDPATAPLFPEHFDHKADGVVPTGWNRKRWGDIATLEYGKSIRDYRESRGKYRVFGTNGPIGFHDESLCNSAGIIIGRKGAYRGVHYSPEPFFAIDTAFYLKPTATLDLKWAYYELLRFDINSMDSGSAIPSTSRDDFYGIPVIVPPPEIQAAFGNIVGGWFAKVFANDRESGTLATLRDTLLPKLLKGELSVAELRSEFGT